MQVLHPRMEILPAAQQQLWPLLQPLADLGFVLYGGTATALRLGHRASVDFDFFTDRPLDRTSLLAAMPWLAKAKSLQDQNTAWTLLTSGQSDQNAKDAAPVKLSFFGEIGFGRIGLPEPTHDGVLHVASLADLMATKLKVVLQRAEAKDYIDIAAMLRAGMRLDSGLASARLLFGANYQPSESLKALTFFGDGDLQTLSAQDKTTLIEAVQSVRDLPAVSLLSRKLQLS